ncbi:MAG: SIR2 family protein [Rhizomicrobium sp.]
MIGWSPQFEKLPTFPVGCVGDGAFNDLWKIVERYMQRNPRPQLGLQVNFERVLGEMTSLASWITPSPFGNALHDAVADPGTSKSLIWANCKEGNFSKRHLLIEQQAALLKLLAKHMRKQCAVFDENSKTFASYRKIFEQLADAFDIGIYTLNYDNLAIKARPAPYAGFAGGKFDARGVFSRTDWNFVYHLHGSIHYSLTGLVSQNEVSWIDDLSGDFEDSRELMANMASGFVPIIPTTLIAGGYKLDQLLSDPSQALYSSLVRHVHEADAIIVAGYGFGDVHVNRALKNTFDAFLYNPADRPPVAVLTKTSPPTMTIGEREGHEFFAWELTHSINARFGKIGAENPTPPISELLAEKRFEYSANTRAAVWHGGFLEIESRMNELIAFLST